MAPTFSFSFACLSHFIWRVGTEARQAEHDRAETKAEKCGVKEWLERKTILSQKQAWRCLADGAGIGPEELASLASSLSRCLAPSNLFFGSQLKSDPRLVPSLLRFHVSFLGLAILKMSTPPGSWPVMEAHGWENIKSSQNPANISCNIVCQKPKNLLRKPDIASLVW